MEDERREGTAADERGAAGSDEPAGDAPVGWRREVRAFAELFALSGLALAQPIFDIFGRAPDQFIFRGAERADILAFTAVVLAAVPVLLWLVELLVGLTSAAGRRWVHLAAVGVLAAAAAAQVLGSLLSRRPALALAVLVGVGVGVLHVRTRGLRIWLAFLSPFPVLFAALFLLTSQVAPLLEGPVGALGARVRRPAPVVVVVFDELPLTALLDADGAIDAELFPNFARLADTADWFDQATSVSNFTWHAVPAIATGDLPRDGTTPTAGSHPKNLFTLLGGAMPVHASETVTRLCPSSLCEHVQPPSGGLGGLLRDARDVLVQRLSPDPSERDPVAGLVEDDADLGTDAVAGPDRSAGAAGARFERFLDTFDGDEPALHYAHLLLPHIPYRFLPGGYVYDGPDPDLGRDEDVWTDQAPIVRLGKQRALLQLAYADGLLGRLLDRLEEAGTFDEAVVVVTADHGVSFEPGKAIRGLSPTVAPDEVVSSDLAWVPLLVKRPGQASGERRHDLVRTVDVLPTIADLLDVAIPWDTDGRSAYDGGSGDPDQVSYVSLEPSDRAYDPSEPIVVDRDESHALVLAHATGRFAPRTDGVGGPDRLYRVGPAPELYRRRVEDLGSRLRPVDAEIAGGAAVEVPTGGHLPALVRADVDDLAPGTAVAVAVDGVVWATTEVVDLGDGPELAAILSPEALPPGGHELAVFALA